MIAATQLAENRLLDLIGKYGIEIVHRCVDVMQPVGAGGAGLYQAMPDAPRRALRTTTV
jgi:hypothetical protein